MSLVRRLDAEVHIYVAGTKVVETVDDVGGGRPLPSDHDERLRQPQPRGVGPQGLNTAVREECSRDCELICPCGKDSVKVPTSRFVRVFRNKRDIHCIGPAERSTRSLNHPHFAPFIRSNGEACHGNGRPHRLRPLIQGGPAIGEANVLNYWAGPSAWSQSDSPTRTPLRERQEEVLLASFPSCKPTAPRNGWLGLKAPVR